MNYLKTVLITIILVCGCGNTSTDKTPSDNDCTNYSIVGEVKICIPEIEDMVTIHTNPDFQQIVTNLEMGNRTVLLASLDKSIYDKYLSGIQSYMSPMYYLYTYTATNNIEATIGDVKNLCDTYDSQLHYDSDAWEAAKEKMKPFTDDIEIGTPIVADKYNTNIYCTTYITVMKNINSQYGEYIVVNVASFLVLKERLLLSSFEVLYEDYNSIENAKESNTKIIENLFKLNAL